MLKKIRY